MKSDFKLHILLYHGVTSIKSKGIENSSNKHIHVDSFEREMAFIKKNYPILSMDEVISIYKKNKKIKGEYFAVTFDDGFKNNFTDAYPILLKYEVPATFYISTGMINSKKLFWVDKIECCINNSKKNKFDIKIQNKYYSFDLSNKFSKIKALTEIKKLCKLLPKKNKDKVIKDLSSTLNITPSIKYGKNYETLTWANVRKMNKSKLITFGAHTIDHDILSYLKKNEMEYQVTESIKKLSSEISENVRHFSYPEGQQNHFNKDVIRFLKKKGIHCSPSAINGICSSKDNLFNLKRIMVGFNNLKFPKKIK